MRLDKHIAKSLACTRSSAKKKITSGCVSVNQQIQKKAGYIVNAEQQVCFNGVVLTEISPVYILLNKPKGYVCSTRDENYPSALNLITHITSSSLHFAGRLDQDTTGLVLISDDGQWTHRITSPKHKQNKTYLVTTSEKLSAENIQRLENGLMLTGEDKPTKPAKVSIFEHNMITLTITEGRYHQVKRMIAAVGSSVTKLHRLSIGKLSLSKNLKPDNDLQPGEWRFLEKQEINYF